MQAQSIPQTSAESTRLAILDADRVGSGRQIMGDRVRQAFPAQEQQILELCARSSGFADLCRDYEDVLDTLDVLAISRRTARSVLERQADALRAEIAQALEVVVTRPGWPGDRERGRE